ncbi:MAG TPA: ketosynthase [Xanthomonadaceae bacterium]|nr:ketosynthase [Xanthomonadaceae bacterium]
MPALALALAYPLLAHLAAYWRSPLLAALSCTVLVVLVLYPGLRARRALAWLALALALAAASWLARSELAALPLYLPPVLVPGFMAWLFGRTLVRGRRPLIERMAAHLHGSEPLDPGIPAYARRVTAVWAVVLATLAAINLLLALLAVPGGVLEAVGITPSLPVSQQLWSLVANLGTYAAIAALFVGEYLWRRRRFPALPHLGFGDFLARVVKLPRSFWRGLVE